MEFTALQISQLLQGEVEGNPEAKVFTLSKIEEGVEGSLSFLANPKYLPYIYTTGSSVVIVSKDFIPEKPIKCTLIRVEDPYSAFSILLEKYNSIKLNKSGIEQPSFIHPSVKIPANCYIGAFAYIGEGVKLGENVKIYPQTFVGENSEIMDSTVLYAGVKVYADTKIGKNCILHSGVVIGSDGFGFAPKSDGSYSKIQQIGNVVIEDDVEIGANTTIDCATMGSTIIRQGAKLDNLIQIAHNVEVGKNVVIASQAGVSGSTKIGENTILGGQVGVVGHISIAKGSKINAKSGISKSILEEDQKWNGTPAQKFTDSLRSQAVLRRLPEIEKKIAELELLLKEIKATSI